MKLALIFILCSIGAAVAQKATSVWYPPEYRVNLAAIPKMEIMYQVNNETYTSTLTKTGGDFYFDVLATPVTLRILRRVTLTQALGNGAGGDFYFEEVARTGYLSWWDIPDNIQRAMGRMSYK